MVSKGDAITIAVLHGKSIMNRDRVAMQNSFLERYRRFFFSFFFFFFFGVEIFFGYSFDVEFSPLSIYEVFIAFGARQT